MVDHLGRIIDGDQLLYVIARGLQAQGALRGPVVGTVMSNLGLEHALGKLGIEFRRAAVGDRYVIAMMRETGAILGGETSGHILCLDRTTTGDGLVSGLQVLAMLKSLGATLAEVVAEMPRYPQVLINVRIARKIDLKGCAPVQEAVAASEGRLAGRGRVVLRPSGTEPLIRVMVEGDNDAQVRREAETIAEAVRAAAI